MEPEPHYEDFRNLRRKIFEWEGTCFVCCLVVVARPCLSLTPSLDCSTRWHDEAATAHKQQLHHTISTRGQPTRQLDHRCVGWAS